MWEQWEWPWLGNRRPGYCFSSLYPARNHRTLNSQACTMAFPGRSRPCTIPENEEIPPTVLNNVPEANGNEDERAVSKLQRRHSDVKVYKEFCDFYAKLWVSPLPEWLSNLQLFSSAFPNRLIQLMCFNLAWLFQGVRRAWGGSRIALSYKLLPEDITDVKENATFLGKIESSHLSNNGTFSWEKLALCVIRIYNRKKYTLKVLKDETKTLIDKHFAKELFHNQYLRWLVNSQDIWQQNFAHCCILRAEYWFYM